MVNNIGKNITEIANSTSKQINPVNIITWALYPSLIGVLFCFLIIFLWKPKFNGQYTYYQCPPSDSKVVRTREEYKKDCIEKKGSIAKRNIIIIIILFVVFPIFFASIGFNIGFAIQNPKIYTGIYGVKLAKSAILN